MRSILKPSNQLIDLDEKIRHMDTLNRHLITILIFKRYLAISY